MFRRIAFLACFSIVAIAIAGLGRAPTNVDAHHDDNGHAGYLFLPTYELNGKTTTAQSIPVRLLIYDAFWANALALSKNNWNAAINPVAGFDPYVDYSGTDFIRVDVGYDVNVCMLLSDGSPAHGCVSEWVPNTPTARIYMYRGPSGGPYIFTDQNHRISDLMHEMGHVLYNAGEHYSLPGYGCSGTASIMNHCFTTTVTTDDLADYRAAYGMIDAPDATYVQMFGSGTATHYFEGGYLGGNGQTLHSEQNNWIDRSTGGVGGAYTNYSGAPRKVTNADDTTPENDSFNDVPPTGAEWCFKRRGRAGGLSTVQANYWGPYSRGYCLKQATTGSGIFIASNRNSYVAFRVWNYSGSTKNFVSLLLSNGTHVCDLPDMPNNTSQVCFWYGSGGTSGFVNLWYGLVNHGSVGYDSQ